MTRATVSIANAHDGVALTGANGRTLAGHLLAAREDLLFDGSGETGETRLLREVANILSGLRRDGSKPEGEAS